MRKILYLTAILTIGLTGCNPKIDFSKVIPDNVNNFGIEFISELHNGNIDSCLTLVSSEMNDEKGRQYLTNTYSNIKTFSIDSFSIINAQKTSLLGQNGFTDYRIDYEYIVGDKFLYFTFGIREQSNKLTISAFDGSLLNDSLSIKHAFTLKNKGFFHYLFLFLAILIPIFIIFTLVFAIRTKLSKKWLWILGILFGFIKFSINWTTGQIGFSLINFSILGAGFSKSGNIAPWILSFSVPIVAIIFWYKRYSDNKEAETQKHRNKDLEAQENQDKNE